MPSVELELAPTWDRVAGVVQEARAFFASAGVDPEAAEAMGMIATELCENAVKYGKREPVRLQLHARDTELVVDVSNAIDERAVRHVSRIADTLTWMKSFVDPFHAYVARMKMVSSQELESFESGLGLLRVAAEGQAVLSFKLDGNRVVTVSATRPR